MKQALLLMFSMLLKLQETIKSYKQLALLHYAAELQQWFAFQSYLICLSFLPIFQYGIVERTSKFTLLTLDKIQMKRKTMI